MNANCVIIDANIAFKCLCTSRGNLRRRLAPTSELNFYSPRYLLVELFKHKERLVRATGLAETDLLEGLYTIVSQLEFVNEANLPLGTWMEAYRLCKEVDKDDTPYVALALDMDGQLWTEDSPLIEGLKARGFDQFFQP